MQSTTTTAHRTVSLTLYNFFPPIFNSVKYKAIHKESCSNIFNLFSDKQSQNNENGLQNFAILTSCNVHNKIIIFTPNAMSIFCCNSLHSILWGMWMAQIFHSTQKSSCLKLLQPTSYTVLMKRILSEFCLKVPRNTNNSMSLNEHQNTKRLFLICGKCMIDGLVLVNQTTRQQKKTLAKQTY